MVVITRENVQKVEADVEKIWDSLGGFSSYSFNKSHALAYSMIAYATMNLYTYRWEEFLQYQLNYSGEAKFEVAIQKLKENGYNLEFPDYTNMMSTDFVVYSNRTRVKKDTGETYVPEEGKVYNDEYLMKNNGNIRKVIIPAGERTQYSDLQSALFDNTISNVAFLKGCFDMVVNKNGRNNRVFTLDREGLLDLISAIPKAGKDKMMLAPMTGNETFDDLLVLMKQAEVVTGYEKSKTGQYDIYVKPYRGKVDKHIIVKSNTNPDVITANIEYDQKYFKTIRPGLIGPKPSELEENEMFWQSFINVIERKKQIGNDKFGEGWYDKNPRARKQFLDSIKADLNERLYSPKYKEKADYDPKVLDPIRVIIKGINKYDRNAKLTVKFANGEDFYYIPADWYKALSKCSGVVEIVLYFSPFIKHKTGEYVEDYDVISIKDLETGLMLNKDAVIAVGEDASGKTRFEPNPNWTDKLITY